jgi:hypothetical protein
MTLRASQMTLRASRAGWAVAVLGALAIAAPARAAVPSAEKVRKAVASSNAAAKRSQPLLLDVALVSETGQVAAAGQARLDPTGSSRLDLRLGDGRDETHERNGSSYRVTREGAPVDRSPPLLPPVRLLLAPSAEALAAALADLGADAERVDLGIEGEHDCWVLGGRDPGPFGENARASLWIDLDSRQPVRIDEAGGAHFRLGPSALQNGVRFPTWIDVEAPGWPRWRMEIRRVAPAASPADHRAGGPGRMP